MAFNQRLARKGDKVVYSAILNLKGYTSLLINLLQDSETYLGVLEWRSSLPFRGQLKTAIVDSQTPLVSAGDNPVLCIPEWRKIRVLDLLIFYVDGSILSAKLGSGDSIRVIRGTADSMAVRVSSAVGELLKPGRRRWRGTLIPFGLFIAVVLLGARLPVWLLLLSSVTALYALPTIGGQLRPRENWLRFGWQSLEWAKSDVRGFLVNLLMLLVGYFIGR